MALSDVESARRPHYQSTPGVHSGMDLPWWEQTEAAFRIHADESLLARRNGPQRPPSIEEVRDNLFRQMEDPGVDWDPGSHTYKRGEFPVNLGGLVNGDKHPYTGTLQRLVESWGDQRPTAENRGVTLYRFGIPVAIIDTSNPYAPGMRVNLTGEGDLDWHNINALFEALHQVAPPELGMQNRNGHI